jgi:acetoin utilization deacetylase AcuC-like enzyme
VKVVYSSRYELALPGHIWPTSKYRSVADALALEPGPAHVTFVEPEAASWDDLARVHTAEYLRKLRDDRLSAEEVAVLELPWAPGMADIFRLMAGGTISAAEAAVEEGAAAHLGGGLHHAFANHGEGFCPLNDIAVAIRALQQQARIRRAAVVDLDVHHGNGTAMIFEKDETVFTFSMHQQHNYPVFKPRGDLDIGLETGTGDDGYLARLRDALPQVVASRPDLMIYVAGADPFEGDRLGGLTLTKAGLRSRDRMVVDAARIAGVPIATVLAGGYASHVRDTVDIHVNTIRCLLG